MVLGHRPSDVSARLLLLRSETRGSSRALLTETLTVTFVDPTRVQGLEKPGSSGAGGVVFGCKISAMELTFWEGHLKGPPRRAGRWRPAACRLRRDQSHIS